MSTSSKGTPSDPCAREDLTPRRPQNRPSLTEINYRIGQHGEFLKRMLWGFPRETVPGVPRPPLENLKARTTDDPSIALADAWASTLDVLTFYQERIANEGYLRTAKERVSALELARTLGYELDPGVAASAYLAFMVEDADDPFRLVEVPKGTQVMSVPQEKDEFPQLFETTETIEARAEWNAMAAQTERPQDLVLYYNANESGDSNNGRLYLIDTDNSFDINTDDFEPDELLTIDDTNLARIFPVTAGLDVATVLQGLQDDYALNPEIDPVIQAIAVDEVQIRGTGLGLSKGDRLIAVAARTNDDDPQEVHARPFRIAGLEEDADYGMTRVDLVPIKAQPHSRRRLLGRLRFRPARLRIGKVSTTWFPLNMLNVQRELSRVIWTGPRLKAFVRTQRWSRLKLMRLIRRPRARQITAPQVGEAEPGLYVMRQRAGFFGHSAPMQETLAKADETRGTDKYINPWDSPQRSIWMTSQGVVLDTGDHVFLERDFEEAVPESWVLIETPMAKTLILRVGRASTQSRTDFAISGKTTGLAFRLPNGDPFSPVDSGSLKNGLEDFTFRTATAYLASEAVELAGLPIREDVRESSEELTLESLFLDLEPRRAISLSGERGDAPGVTESESIILKSVSHIGGHTRLRFKTGTSFDYRRPTVRVNANLALSTHGETIKEILGSGDATQTNQAFALAKKPLTFEPAETETGSASTLVVRVNGIRWREVESLYDAGLEDESFMVRIDDEGTTRVIFGDGVHGKRLPTGSANVEAIYRAGMGAEGEVAEETLIQLKTRPLGIRAVMNASAASGAAPPMTLEEARTRGPDSVRTLGRIVSLTDYRDFARSFTGIGKAQADVVWYRGSPVIHVTVAPVSDSEFDPAAPTLEALRGAMKRFRDPAMPLLIQPHEPRFFTLAAKVSYDPRHLADDVEISIRDTLEKTFGYEPRALSQPVSAAEVIASIQGVGGVVFVVLDVLQLSHEGGDEQPATFASVLVAQPARVAEDDTEIIPAELLTVLAPGVELTMEAADAEP